MAYESSNKVKDRQGHDFFGVRIVVEILIGNSFSVAVLFDSCFTDRRTLEVFSQIIDIVFHIV